MGNGEKPGVPKPPGPLRPIVPLNPKFTALLAWDRWQSARVDGQRIEQASRAAFQILTNMTRYKAVGDQFQIPYWVIGVIHYRESDFDFATWLANGDPITELTSHVPKGLGPVKTWEEGAVMSLRYEGWHSGMEWDLANALLHLEAYNGMGYANMGLVSPYIFSGTNLYVRGKYTEDHKYDPNLVDPQLGCATIAKVLKLKGVELNEVPQR